MQKITIKKGHNINISGLASREFSNAPMQKFVSISPQDFNYIKPKLLVKEGDQVSVGDALFFDKINPEVKWPSIASGTISKIVYGERRAVLDIIIEVDEEKEKNIESDKQINLSSKDNVKEFIQKHNFWPFFTQRPFNKVVNPSDNPKCIVVSLADSSPLANDLSFSLAEKKEYIISALSNLKKLTDGHLYVAVRGDNFSFLSDYDFINLIQVEGPHPSGNVGVILNKVNPLNQNEVVWTVQGSHLPVLGKLFSKGVIDFSLIFSFKYSSLPDTTTISFGQPLCLSIINLKTSSPISSAFAIVHIPTPATLTPVATTRPPGPAPIIAISKDIKFPPLGQDDIAKLTIQKSNNSTGPDLNHRCTFPRRKGPRSKVSICFS